MNNPVEIVKETCGNDQNAPKRDEIQFGESPKTRHKATEPDTFWSKTRQAGMKSDKRIGEAKSSDAFPFRAADGVGGVGR